MDRAGRNKSPERILRIDLTSPILLVKSFLNQKRRHLGKSFRRSHNKVTSGIWHNLLLLNRGGVLKGSMIVFLCSSQYASTHHGAQQGRQPAGHLTCVRHGTYLRGGTGYSITGSGCDPPVSQGTLTAIPNLKQPSLVFQKNPYWNTQN
ncbi:hypothetical protein TNCV_3633451 [Trichonephila clavipes]|nr:hypothetical protein TNCV_3633451 [Trichonephila clavipes]